MAFDTVCVVGLGYIGLPTAAILAAVFLYLADDIDIAVNLVPALYAFNH